MITRGTIPYGRQSISEADIDAVVSVLRSDYLTTGPKISEFENAVAEYCGAKYCVAVANATAALHIACRALKLSSDEHLWTSPNTFVASANCADQCGAQADFVDIDPVTLNISTDELEKKLKSSPPERLPKIVIPVHFAGRSCDMKKLRELGNKYRFKIIEDAAHAIGTEFEGKRVGNCRYSDMTVFSFHPVKNITTGEGGMITTNDSELYERLKVLRTIGITRDTKLMTNRSEGAWYYEQIDLGFNYRMTDIEAALGISQLRRLNSFVVRRAQLFERYNRLLSDMPLILPPPEPGVTAWHLYVVQLKSGNKLNRRQVFDRLREAGIGVNVHYIPVHLQPWYRAKGFKESQFPNSELYYSRALSLPIFQSMTDSDQDYVIEVLRKIFDEN